MKRFRNFLLKALGVVCAFTATFAIASCGDDNSGSSNAHVHSHASVVTPPTCTEEGYTTFTCECGDTYKSAPVSALGHNKELHSAKAPTCTTVGYKAYEECTRCDYTTYVEIPALGHNYRANITKYPAYQQKGERTYACATCSHSYTEDIAALTVNLPTVSEFIQSSIVSLNHQIVVEENSNLVYVKEFDSNTNREGRYQSVKIKVAEAVINTEDTFQGHIKLELRLVENALTATTSKKDVENSTWDKFAVYLFVNGEDVSLEVAPIMGEKVEQEGKLTDIVYTVLANALGMSYEDFTNLLSFYVKAQEEAPKFGEMFENMETPEITQDYIDGIVDLFELFGENIIEKEVKGENTEYTVDIAAFKVFLEKVEGKTIGAYVDEMFGAGSMSSLSAYVVSLPEKKIKDIAMQAITVSDNYGIDIEEIYDYISVLMNTLYGVNIDIKGEIHSRYEMTLADIIIESSGDENLTVRQIKQDVELVMQAVAGYSVEDVLSMFVFGSVGEKSFTEVLSESIEYLDDATTLCLIVNKTQALIGLRAEINGVGISYDLQNDDSALTLTGAFKGMTNDYTVTYTMNDSGFAWNMQGERENGTQFNVMSVSVSETKTATTSKKTGDVKFANCDFVDFEMSYANDVLVKVDAKLYSFEGEWSGFESGSNLTRNDYLSVFYKYTNQNGEETQRQSVTFHEEDWALEYMHKHNASGDNWTAAFGRPQSGVSLQAVMSKELVGESDVYKAQFKAVEAGEATVTLLDGQATVEENEIIALDLLINERDVVFDGTIQEYVVVAKEIFNVTYEKQADETTIAYAGALRVDGKEYWNANVIFENQENAIGALVGFDATLSGYVTEYEYIYDPYADDWFETSSTFFTELFAVDYESAEGAEGLVFTFPYAEIEWALFYETSETAEAWTLGYTDYHIYEGEDDVAARWNATFAQETIDQTTNYYFMVDGFIDGDDCMDFEVAIEDGELVWAKMLTRAWSYTYDQATNEEIKSLFDVFVATYEKTGEGCAEMHAIVNDTEYIYDEQTGSQTVLIEEIGNFYFVVDTTDGITTHTADLVINGNEDVLDFLLVFENGSLDALTATVREVKRSYTEYEDAETGEIISVEHRQLVDFLCVEYEGDWDEDQGIGFDHITFTLPQAETDCLFAYQNTGEEELVACLYTQMCEGEELIVVECGVAWENNEGIYTYSVHGDYQYKGADYLDFEATIEDNALAEFVLIGYEERSIVGGGYTMEEVFHVTYTQAEDVLNFLLIDGDVEWNVSYNLAENSGALVYEWTHPNQTDNEKFALDFIEMVENDDTMYVFTVNYVRNYEELLDWCVMLEKRVDGENTKYAFSETIEDRGEELFNVGMIVENGTLTQGNVIIRQRYWSYDEETETETFVVDVAFGAGYSKEVDGEETKYTVEYVLNEDAKLVYEMVFDGEALSDITFKAVRTYVKPEQLIEQIVTEETGWTLSFAGEAIVLDVSRVEDGEWQDGWTVTVSKDASNVSFVYEMDDVFADFAIVCQDNALTVSVEAYENGTVKTVWADATVTVSATENGLEFSYDVEKIQLSDREYVEGAGGIFVGKGE